MLGMDNFQAVMGRKKNDMTLIWGRLSSANISRFFDLYHSRLAFLSCDLSLYIPNAFAI